MTTKNTIYQVTIETRGQAGSVNYREGSNTIKFDWEFGGYNVLAMVWGPETTLWDKLYPWAKGRKKEIMQRIASEVIKQKAPTCTAEINYERTIIYIRKR